jgi:hypothetical protein
MTDNIPKPIDLTVPELIRHLQKGTLPKKYKNSLEVKILQGGEVYDPEEGILGICYFCQHIVPYGDALYRCQKCHRTGCGDMGAQRCSVKGCKKMLCEDCGLRACDTQMEAVRECETTWCPDHVKKCKKCGDYAMCEKCDPRRRNLCVDCGEE